MSFALGQRWISDTESDLGLGTVVAVDGRTVSLLFLASEESRIYAKHDAPVTRVTFNRDDTIESHEGWLLKVEEIQEEKGVLTYIGLRLDTQERNIAINETRLSHQIRFNKPQDKLFAGLIDRQDHFVLRFESLQNQYQQQRNSMRGLCGIRAGLIPHQLFIAHEVGRRYAPRVLLADEVGLGKTIEAGMIIHQQVISGRAERIVIVVPETLQHQWLVEMMRRFNLHFSIFDEERCIEACGEDENPFDTAQLVLCSLDFICQNPNRFQQIAEAHWDLLIVDEAHHLEWDKDHPSREYQIVEALSQKTAGVLLLTATPEQLGHESHFARLRLLDPDRFYNYDAFVEEEKQYQPVADAVTTLMESEVLSNEVKNRIAELLSEQDIEPLFKILESSDSEEEKANIRQELIDDLMDRHGTGRILFRNTRAAIKGFPTRHLHLTPIALPSQYENAMRVTAMMENIDESAINQSTINQSATDEKRAIKKLYPEEIFQELGGADTPWWQFDPRVDWLLNFLKTNRNKKVLIIASRASTALQLEQALREREGIRGTVFHENMSIIERDKAAAYFAQEEGGAQVLICSEIGSEGRNFQFANQLVMFDLPLNPDLLEQRIGRLDRIGQTSDIDIYVPYLQHSSQELLARWFNEGLNAFTETCPTGRAVYEHFYDRILSMLVTGDTNGLDKLIEESMTLNKKLKQQLEKGRDRLLEMHSNGGDKATQLVKKVAAMDSDIHLATFALSLFDTIGLNQDDKGENALVITPAENMLVSSYPGLPEDGCTVTFDRETALAREDMSLLSWEHPMIQGGMDLVLTEGIGSNTVSLLKNKALPVGTLLLELIYVVDAQAPKKSGLTRFLPKTPIRILMDAKGNDLSEKVDFKSFVRQLRTVHRNIGSRLVNSVQKELRLLIEKAEISMNERLKTIRLEAETEMKTTLNLELDRLQALKAVNPNIREEELTQIENQMDELSNSIAKAQVQLDSLRVIVVSHD